MDGLRALVRSPSAPLIGKHQNKAVVFVGIVSPFANGLRRSQYDELLTQRCDVIEHIRGLDEGIKSKTRRTLMWGFERVRRSEVCRGRRLRLNSARGYANSLAWHENPQQYVQQQADPRTDKQCGKKAAAIPRIPCRSLAPVRRTPPPNNRSVRLRRKVLTADASGSVERACSVFNRRSLARLNSSSVKPPFCTQFR